ARRLGLYEGRRVSEIELTAPASFRLLKEDFDHVPPDGGESARVVHERALPRLMHWATRYPAGNIVIVTHAIVVKVLLHGIMGFDYRRPPVASGNSTVHIIAVEPDGLRYVRTLDAGATGRDGFE
ncbi:histidine phosphatase family protein, partial [bacterium]|nr:histidine phosphatase family protein [candidate division CSSED10-310 bacterium]